MKEFKFPNPLLKLPWAAAFLLIILAVSGCRTGSAPVRGAEIPTNGPRSMNGAWIAFTAIGEDRFAERASFLAENSALADVANECSFIPKATVHQVFESSAVVKGADYRQFVGKTFIDRTACDDAKHAVHTDRIGELANTELMNRLQAYQDTIGEVTKASSATVERLTKAGLENETDVFALRQQILYMKQALLAGTVQPTKQPGALEDAIAKVADYESKHPELANSTQSWSASQRRVFGTIMEPVLSPDAPVKGSREKSSKRPRTLPPKSYPKRR